MHDLSGWFASRLERATGEQISNQQAERIRMRLPLLKRHLRPNRLNSLLRVLTDGAVLDREE